MKTALFTSLLTLTLLLARIEAAEVTITGSIVNHKGKPFAGVTVHAMQAVEDDVIKLKTRTDADGNFRFVVPGGFWLVRVDPDELLVRGYACFPDFSQPVFTDIQLLTFEVIPTRPVFDTPQLIEGKILHTVTFETTTVAPIQTIRTYNVQWSSDQKQWKTLTSVSLLTSPLQFEDPDPGPAMKFYRAVLIEPEEEGRH